MAVDSSTGAVLFGLVILYTILLLYWYHKSRVVVYFGNKLSAQVKELCVAFFVAFILMALTLNFWYIAVIIIILFAFGLISKTYEGAKKVVIIVATVVICFFVGKAGITYNSYEKQTAEMNEQNYQESYDDYSHNTYENESNVLDNITGDKYALENYINQNMTADEMGEALQLAGLDFILDESGYYTSANESVWIYNTDMGGCQLYLNISSEPIYSIYGLYCGMSLEEAEQILDKQGAIEFTYEDDSAVRRYKLFDSYSVLLSLGENEITGIEFNYFLYE